MLWLNIFLKLSIIFRKPNNALNKKTDIKHLSKIYSYLLSMDIELKSINNELIRIYLVRSVARNKYSSSEARRMMGQHYKDVCYRSQLCQKRLESSFKVTLYECSIKKHWFCWNKEKCLGYVARHYVANYFTRQYEKYIFF